MTGRDPLTADLLARAQRGEVDALGELLDLQRDDLRRLADRMLDDRIRRRLDASDLVQQTCLSVHKRMLEFQGADPAQFVAWLRQVHEHNVRNAIRDHVHAGRRAASRDRPLDEFEAADPAAETPSRLLIRREDEARLRVALDRLPADEQQAVRLRYQQGRTVPEVAIEMGISRDACVWLLRRALRRVRTELAGDV